MAKKLHGYNGVGPIILTINFVEIAMLLDGVRAKKARLPPPKYSRESTCCK